jgi:hypothetical protein
MSPDEAKLVGMPTASVGIMSKKSLFQNINGRYSNQFKIHIP